MISRTNSDAGTRLRRAKSSASVTQRRSIHCTSESIDPEISRQHALIASHIAMERASERASADSRRPIDLSRADSAASRSKARLTPRSGPLRFTDSAELHRQRSLHPINGPNLKSSINMPLDSSYQHSVGPSFSEFGGPEQYGAQPSSYRKLHKAKSLLIPNSRASDIHQIAHRSTVSRRSLRSDYRSTGDPRAGLILGFRRSISFLKESGGNISRTFKKSHADSDSHDEAIQMARDHFLQSLAEGQQENLSEKPTSIFSLRNKRQQKPFRKTVRSTRTTDFGNAISSPAQCVQEKETLVGSESGVFPRSFRHRMNKLFRRSMNNFEGVPTQHLNASRPHFRHYEARDNTTKSNQIDLGEDGHYNADFHLCSAPNGDQQASAPEIPSPQGSLRSMRSAESLSNSKSRVTSWTNSIADQTIADRLPVERKRLSVIQEFGGPHQPSSSAGMHKDGILAFQNPLRNQTSSGRVHAPVDSQRLYSALVKRLDEVQEDHHCNSSQEEPAPQEVQPCFLYPEGVRASRTIRAVPVFGPQYNLTVDNSIRECSSESMPSQKYTFKDVSVPSSPQQMAQITNTIQQPWNSSFHDANLPESPKPSAKNPCRPNSFKSSLIGCQNRADVDEDTSSVVVSRKDLDGSITSASIYSRTTSGKSPNLSAHEISSKGGKKPTSTIDERIWQADPANMLQDADPGFVPDWKTKINNQILSMRRRGSNRSHYREKAQIGDEEDTSIGTRQIRHAPPGGRPIFDMAVDTSHVKPYTRQPSTTGDNLPMLELKEVPRNTYPEPRQSSEHFTPARAHWKRNDENKRLDPKPSTYRLRLKASQLSLNSATAHSSAGSSSDSGGRTPPPQSSSLKIRKAVSYAKVTPPAMSRRGFCPQSQIALAAQDRPSSRNESESVERKGTFVLSPSRPFESELVYRYPALGEDDGAGSSTEKMDYANDEAGQSGRDEHPRLPLPGFLSRKRMVSNFLKSRRREREGIRDGSGASVGSGAGAFL